ncbi:hypothetical protein H2201_003048 [Coniosporium apollinis]|uniref:Uncharacterized protein n=1 Tax=Coniosporium apollinis TaxID=61459 RepID=A0ABQ9NX00_9PEZI|nr:hypothetical protein H2201_003048 [Coniosporium apollinis]
MAQGSSPASPSTHSPSHSLAAAAALNAGIHNEEARRSPGSSVRNPSFDNARRRSSIRMNLHLNDPGVPGPGELQMSPGLRHSMTWGGSPRHERTPSLGELHQELESEQEGQVNRLLNMIRAQQAQIAALQSSQPSSTAAVVDDSTPTSERSLSFPSHPPHPTTVHTTATTIPIPRTRSPAPYAPSRNPSQQHTNLSRTSSHASNSPALHPLHPHSSHGGGDEFLLGLPAARDRDDAAYYQAETQSLVRENQMLKLRIRELERLVGEMNTSGGGAGGGGGHEPGRSSNLVSAPVESSEGESGAGAGAGAEGREGRGGE